MDDTAKVTESVKLLISRHLARDRVDRHHASAILAPSNVRLALLVKDQTPHQYRTSPISGGTYDERIGVPKEIL